MVEPKNMIVHFKINFSSSERIDTFYNMATEVKLNVLIFYDSESFLLFVSDILLESLFHVTQLL